MYVPNPHASAWDFAPGERVVADLGPLKDESLWLEEVHFSPDGEQAACVARTSDEDEAAFVVTKNGEAVSDPFERIWLPKFAPDGRHVAIASDMGEWKLMLEGEASEEGHGYLWDIRFADTGKGSTIACAVQDDMTYAMLVNGQPWETYFENANNFALAADGSKSAAVVQAESWATADIQGFKKGCFSVAVDGTAWDKNFLNCYSPVFSPDAKHLACQVRTSLTTYSIAVDGDDWPHAFSGVWEPVFSADGRRVFAPVKTPTGWTLAEDGKACWDGRFQQLWMVTPCADGTIHAVGSDTFGEWKLVKDGKTYGVGVNKALFDLVVSPDGCRAAVLGKQDDSGNAFNPGGGTWRVIVDGEMWPGKHPMAFSPVFSADSRHVAARVELQDGRYGLVVDGKPAPDLAFDAMSDPAFSPSGDAVMVAGMQGAVVKRVVLPLSAF